MSQALAAQNNSNPIIVTNNIVLIRLINTIYTILYTILLWMNSFGRHLIAEGKG